ncbi:hypothetical protein KUV47_17820 [Vannielia litorea]|uniref:hypothetical protein n=1 Tax=Vannielia litorea TaxID=1217970 RepID=UPI001C956C0C|nr:hypothetical protein [Vannielia litorea]MBY6155085.1 hypothetical protein [Vannielia litorea]
MIRPIALALACLLPLPAAAQQATGFETFGLTLEGGGHPAGDYLGLTGEARAIYGLGWGELAVDLSLSTTEAGSESLTAAGVLVHASARPASWVALGPYLWLGSQSEGGGAYALGVEAAVQTASGWGGELWFGETRGGVLGDDGYATNKGLRVGYTGQGSISAYGAFLKDTANLASGDQDFYRLALGVETWLEMPGSGREIQLSVAAGQHHFDLLDERENWVAVGITIPLDGRRAARPEFSSRRGVLHNLPLP